MSSPNILLIVLDTARQKTINGMINEGQLENIQQITSNGLEFKSATANGPWTLPTHASIFTGQRTSDHQTHAGSTFFDPQTDTLAERLSMSGYRTAGISGNTWISPSFGFDRGFDQFSMKWDYFWNSIDITPVVEANGLKSKIKVLAKNSKLSNAPETALNTIYAKFLANRYDDGAKNTTSRAISWINQQTDADKPFFLFLNYFEPHLEYDPPKEYQDQFLDKTSQKRAKELDQDPWKYLAGESNIRASDFEILHQLYKAELSYVDKYIGEIMKVLEENNDMKNTCVIIVGDHGENIGEHGLMDHQYSLYETLVNVPLVIRYPDLFDEGRTINTPVETRDIFPTILEIANVQNADDDRISSHSLCSRPARDYVISEYRVPQPSMESIRDKFGYLPEKFQAFDRGLRSVRKGDWKLIEGTDGTSELYYLREDPDEKKPIDDPDKTEQLLNKFDQERLPNTVEDVNSREIEGAIKDRLEELGYL